MKVMQLTNSDDEIEILSENIPLKSKTYMLKEEVTLSSDDEEYESKNQTTKESVSDCSEYEDDDEENLPSGNECLQRCKEFATVTGTDSALAMFYLQDSKWDLQVFSLFYY